MRYKFRIIKEVSDKFSTVYITGQENGLGNIAGF
jgi:hypothetical protein